MLNDEEFRVLVIQKTRRDLLTTLKMWYPSSPSFREIRLTLPEIEDRYLRVDLSYLCDKSYVAWVNEAPNMEWSRREFKLTAKGVEVADRIENDPALGA